MSEYYPDIWRLQAQGNIRGLIEATKHANPDVRRRAVAALRTLGASSAIPALQVALVKEQDNEVRRAIIATLDSLFQQEVDEDSDSSDDQYTQVVRLIAQLSSRQPERIIRASQRLGELKEKIAAESLILVFHNTSLPARARLAAAEALLKLESAPIEVALLGAMRHADWRVRRNAIAVLGQLNADWAVGPLSDALKDDSDLIRRTAQAALKRIGTPEALIALAAASLAERQAAATPPTADTKKVDAAAKLPPVTAAPPDTKAETTDETRPARLPIPVEAKPETVVKTPSAPPPVETKVEAQAEPAPSTPAVPADTQAESRIDTPAAPERSTRDDKAAVETPPAEPKVEAAAETAPSAAPPADPPQTSAAPAAESSPDEEDTQPTLPVG